MKKYLLLYVLSFATLLSLNSASFFDISKKPTIIVIHGCSSSGKSSTAKALQSLYASYNKPFIYLPLDDIISFLPKKWANLNPHDKVNTERAEDGLNFIIKPSDEPNTPPTVQILIGQTVVNAAHGIVQMLKGFADTHNNIIFEGAFPIWMFDDIEELQKTYTIYIVTITCDLEVMEKREVQRNGLIGLTRSQHTDPEYHYQRYDLNINTSHITPQEAAERIKAFVDQKELSIGCL